MRDYKRRPIKDEALMGIFNKYKMYSHTKEIEQYEAKNKTRKESKTFKEKTT